MKTLKDIMYVYYLAKGEKAMKEGDYETANKCKSKMHKNLYKKLKIETLS